MLVIWELTNQASQHRLSANELFSWPDHGCIGKAENVSECKQSHGFTNTIYLLLYLSVPLYITNMNNPLYNKENRAPGGTLPETRTGQGRLSVSRHTKAWHGKQNLRGERYDFRVIWADRPGKAHNLSKFEPGVHDLLSPRDVPVQPYFSHLGDEGNNGCPLYG